METKEKFLFFQLWWEIPLALLSLIFYKAVKGLIPILFQKKTKTKKKIADLTKKEVYKWRFVSEELLKQPLVLSYILTTGPRWNVHAIIATTEPVPVKESLKIDISSCVASAQSWSIGIYSFPEGKPVKYIASHEPKFHKQWQEIKLEPGKYNLALRYYNWYDQVSLPAVIMDNNQIINTESVNSSQINNYFNYLPKLIGQDNIFYRFLNYYIFTILVCQKWLPKEWVRKEFLPVGDPNNEFVYGVIYKGYYLALTLNPLLLTNYDVYLTTYNRSSLPINFCQINTDKYTTSVIETDGFYLVRLRPKSDLDNNLFQLNWISTELVSEVSCNRSGGEV
ncbi:MULTISPECIES: DUF6208 family protein [Moorena]|uniref:Uncharacterized protein n=2 Tax=Moorena producens TaxID=1155739 RepID=F4Y422_9CYAN|nr:MULTISPECIES: DUF6208 family protein [Moorena]ACV42479.1 hypothetical protein [Moorena producens 19L]AEE88276.1 hypothetical protein [Moorena producens 3L]EGJ28341.1 hypothetical protein LYNGBM3L_74520 [Moorena producens 3L]NEP29951.1 hypothetical protein [Moorena sp. SIO3B2]NEP67170.1 hypothetical protein [Moorena sp. SIO3A5]